MKKRVFKKIVTVAFYIGVDIIGLPAIHEHRLSLYSIGNHKGQPKWQIPLN